MSYLENIGKNAKKAFKDLRTVKHAKIKNVLDNYNKALLVNKKKIIKENLKDIKSVKRKHLVDRLILNDKRIESRIIGDGICFGTRAFCKTGQKCPAS